jgi:hypothetical protein
VGYAHDMTARLIIGPLSNWCARRFGNEGAAVLEEVAVDLGIIGGRSERRLIIRAAPRYGPPPGSAPVARGPGLPARAAGGASRIPSCPLDPLVVSADRAVRWRVFLTLVAASRLVAEVGNC